MLERPTFESMLKPEALEQRRKEIAHEGNIVSNEKRASLR